MRTIVVGVMRVVILAVVIVSAAEVVLLVKTSGFAADLAEVIPFALIGLLGLMLFGVSFLPNVFDSTEEWVEGLRQTLSKHRDV